VRLALIADLHGNLPALEAVLAELEQETVEGIVCLGDVAVGPQPLETLDRVEALGGPVVMGNWDEYLLDGTPPARGELADVLAEMCTWTAEQLSAGNRRYIGGFRKVVDIQLGDGKTLLAFHGSPRSTEDEIVATTSDERLEEMLEGRQASVFAGGHTHFQLLRRHGESVLVNAGSVGLPFLRRRVGVMQISPWAEYCVISAEPGHLDIDFRRTAFDVDGFKRTMLRSEMPHAERWAALWALP
jgi:predicted phosphodiesterase